MNRTRRRSLATLACLPLSTGAAQKALAQPRAVQRPDADVAALLDTRLGFQGVGLVAVQVQGRELSVVAAGRRAADHRAALDQDALFEVGSITKTFTALLLADAVLRRVLALEDAVEDALPGIRLRDREGEPVRWVDLATHRSGLPRLPSNMAPARPADPYADYGVAQLLDFLRGHRIDVARNTRWAYSNLGYGLLGHALGLACGQAFGVMLQERVLGPLGLHRSRLSTRQQAVEGLAQGHDGAGQPVPHWHFDVMAPAGGLLMPAAELGRYAQAAIGSIDSPLAEAFALTQREHAPGPQPINPIGLGWLRAPLQGRTVLNHDGGTFGFSSSLWLDPGRQRAAAVLANAMVEVKDLALHLLDERVPVKDLSPTRQAEVALSDAQLDRLAGRYALDAGFRIVVRRREGGLTAQATGQDAFPLFAATERRFFAKITPLTIEFDAGEPPAGLTLTQGAQRLRFLREP